MNIFSKLFGLSGKTIENSNVTEKISESVSSTAKSNVDADDMLPIVLKKLVSENGKEYLENKYIVNILTDYQVFKNNRALRNIVSCLVENGFISKLINVSMWDVNHLRIITEVTNGYGLNESLVRFVVKSFGYGLGFESIAPIMHDSQSSFENTKMKVDNNTDSISESSRTKATSSSNININASTPTDIKFPYNSYRFPDTSLLSQNSLPHVSVGSIEKKKQIVQILKTYGVDIVEIQESLGPAVNFYKLTLVNVARMSRVRNNIDSISQSLSVHGARIMAPIPLTTDLGIELPNDNLDKITLKEVLDSNEYNCVDGLPLALGMGFGYKPCILNLIDAPNVLIGCSAYQGLSTCINVILMSFLFKKHPNELKLVLINPRGLEFNNYKPISDHFMASTIENSNDTILSDYKEIERTLNSVCNLIEFRYSLLNKVSCRTIKEYNENLANNKLASNSQYDFMPYVVIIINEIGDILHSKEVKIDNLIESICKKGYTVGVHLIATTHRIDLVNRSTIDGFSTKITLKTISTKESKALLDNNDATKLVGNGDMLVSHNNDIKRVQCAYVEISDIDNVVKYIANQSGPMMPYALPDKAEVTHKLDIRSLDPLFEEVAHLVVNTQLGSTAMVQRQYKIGYNRACRLMDQLELAHIVGPAHGSKPREVLVLDKKNLETIIYNIRSK